MQRNMKTIRYGWQKQARPSYTSPRPLHTKTTRASDQVVRWDEASRSAPINASEIQQPDFLSSSMSIHPVVGRVANEDCPLCLVLGSAGGRSPLVEKECALTPNISQAMPRAGLAIFIVLYTKRTYMNKLSRSLLREKKDQTLGRWA
ncbi:hypothetical protein J3459_007465 [Metarhizium acridum]|nr:hypothetical protein J3459_007465 [Metarhizium acridum]